MIILALCIAGCTKYYTDVFVTEEYYNRYQKGGNQCEEQNISQFLDDWQIWVSAVNWCNSFGVQNTDSPSFILGIRFKYIGENTSEMLADSIIIDSMRITFVSANESYNLDVMFNEYLSSDSSWYYNTGSLVIPFQTKIIRLNFMASNYDRIDKSTKAEQEYSVHLIRLTDIWKGTPPGLNP